MAAAMLTAAIGGAVMHPLAQRRQRRPPLPGNYSSTRGTVEDHLLMR